MKNKKTLIILGLLVIIGVGFFIFKKVTNKVEDPKSLLNDLNTVLVNDNLANQKLEIDGIKITDISLNTEEKTLYLKISSKEKQEQMTLTVVLLNPDVKDSANEKGLVIKDLQEEKIIKIDLNQIFNNPKKIKFVIEK